jgi:hypothetical protein
MILEIVRDSINVKDKGSDQFTKAIIKECNRQNVEYKVTSEWRLPENKLCLNKHYNNQIVLEPNGYMEKENYNLIRAFYNLDQDITAQVCLNWIKGYSVLYGDIKVSILGRGKTLGLPMSILLDRNGIENYSINTKTKNVQLLIDNSDSILIALPFGMKCEYDLTNKYVLDASNSTINPSIDYKTIGKATVQELVNKHIRNYKIQDENIL